MATYNKQFQLSVKDVSLIEGAVRCQISQLAQTETSPLSTESKINHHMIMELMDVLGTLHNQKIWYGQTHHTGIPLG